MYIDNGYIYFLNVKKYFLLVYIFLQFPVPVHGRSDKETDFTLMLIPSTPLCLSSAPSFL